ncbi:MAG: sulfur transferase domain-containing protein [Planctomycetota bacterium]
MRQSGWMNAAAVAGVVGLACALGGCASAERDGVETARGPGGAAPVVEPDAALPPVNRYATAVAQAPVETGAPVEGMDGFYRAGRVVVGPQPTAEDLRAFRERGVGTVVNLRSRAEVEDPERVTFDQAGELRTLGARYEHIPLGGADGYSPEDVERFDAILREADGDVLVHCASGGRARSMWQAWLISKRGYSAEEADAIARSLGQGPSALERLLGEGT